jgi:hypothetical protein
VETRERKNEPGLSLRMQRERRVISAQHRQLDEFYVRLASALDGADLEAARAAFWRFSDALEAHLALEDGLYFPALRGLAPALAADLEALCDEHQRLRERLSAVARALENGVCEACVSPLGQLVSDLADHEGREEGLLASLNVERGR